MALEIPSSLIREIQFTLRREAGIPSYDPNDPSLPTLPTLQEAISALDPSLPPHLRCTRCRGGLLRGPESTVCIFCGADRRMEAPPQAISFNSTAGCRKLLDSLGLDGSEAITLDTESDDSNKGQDVPKGGLILSDLLDLELRWSLETGETDISIRNKVPSQLPLEKEEIGNSSTNKVVSQSSYALNLSGVDLDTFFSDTKTEENSTAPSLSSEKLMPNKQIKTTDSHVLSASQNFSFFENFQSSGIAVTSVNTKDGESGDSFDDWEAEFHSASPSESKSADLFQGSSTAELPNLASAIATFSKKTDVERETIIMRDNEEPRNDEGWLSTSVNGLQDDLWPQTNRVIVNTADHFKSISETNNAELKNDLNYMTSASDSWAQDDLWPISSTQELNNTKLIEDNDDSLDNWQDFTSSGGAQGGVSNYSAQNSTEATDTNVINDTKSLDGNDNFDAQQEFNNIKNGENFDGLLDDWQDFTSLGVARGGLSNSLVQSNIEVNGTEVLSNITNLDDNDDFDAWQNSTTSVEAAGVLSNSWIEKCTKATNSGTKSADLQNMDFGSFLHSDTFKGAIDGKKVSPEANMQLDPSFSDRMNVMNGESWMNSTVRESSDIGEIFTVAPNLEPSNSNIEKLLSKMPDLSFMLESSLSIPKKVDGSGLNP